MKVKIGNIVYDTEDQPIMLVLNAQDRINIASMPPDATKYCAFPEDVSDDEAKAFMELP